MIICLAWGSLIWDPKNLPLVNGEQWEHDGPEIPVEFVRQSDNGCMTLVIDSESEPVPVLWARLKVESITEAVEALRIRERCPSDRPIGRWPSDGRYAAADIIGKWAVSRKFSEVVWTALGPRFQGERGRRPTEAEAVAYLCSLAEDEHRKQAERYVRKAPAQIDTRYRRAFERSLGWVRCE